MPNKIFLKLSLFGFILFLIVTYLVRINFFYSFDYFITYTLQNSLGSFLNLPFSIFSILGSFEVTVIFWSILFIYFIFKKRYFTATTTVLFFAGLLTEAFGKLEIYHKQPPISFYRGVIKLPLPSGLITQAITDNSYPSGHILRTTFLVVIVFFLIKHSNFKFKTILNISLVIYLIIMFISRVYLGEHWVSDTIGGLLLGASLAFIVLSTTNIIKVSKLNTQ